MGTPELTIGLNLGAILGALQRSIQRTLDLVSFGLQAAEKAKDIDRLLLPGIKFHFSIAENRKLDVESARKEFRQWAIGAGLRDCVEAVSPLMEEARSVCALYLLAEKKRIRTDELQKKVFAAMRKYHKVGLPDKIKILKEEYDPILIPELADHILSINAARNCLVHRKGIVAQQDVNSPEGLLVRWRRKEILVRDDEGNEEVIELPYLAEKDVTACLRFVDAGRVFKLGEAINFSAEEFSDLCMTFFFFGQQMVTNLQKFGEAKGMSFRHPE
jgi:hypothetical protein